MADMYKQRGIKYRDLDDVEKLELLTQRGGQFLPTYMGFPGSDKSSRLLGALRQSGTVVRLTIY